MADKVTIIHIAAINSFGNVSQLGHSEEVPLDEAIGVIEAGKAIAEGYSFKVVPEGWQSSKSGKRSKKEAEAVDDGTSS